MKWKKSSKIARWNRSTFPPSGMQILAWFFIFVGWFIPSPGASQIDYHLPFLAKAYEQSHFCTVPLRQLRNHHVSELLQNLHARFPAWFHYEEIGTSVEERPIYLVTLGKGEIRVLLWSQMHGDEPTATAALFDVFYYLMEHRQEPFAQEILEKLTLLAVPMLNPDGAERFTRRNAQGLDINRDARELQTPEGKLLFQLQRNYHPRFGFNLHDQNARRTVGNTNRLVALALMAPPFDTEGHDNPVRIRAKKIVSVIYQAVSTYLYGHIARYDAGYMPRAFGDSMQNWGVSTVLIESGGWYEHRDLFLQKMNFIALLSVFHAIANQSYLLANPALYDVLPQNDRNLYDLLIQDVTIISGGRSSPFHADIAINYQTQTGTDSTSYPVGVIADLGDLDFFAAKDTIQGKNLYLSPGLVTLLRPPPSSLEQSIRRLRELFSMGYTTILLPFRRDQTSMVSLLKERLIQNRFPGNVGALLYQDQPLSSARDSLQIVRELATGFLGVLWQNREISDSSIAQWLHKPSHIFQESACSSEQPFLTPSDIRRHSAIPAAKWHLPRRGTVAIGQVADLILFAKEPREHPLLKMILIKGYPVWKEGKWMNDSFHGEFWLPARR